jgi:hypothetical protein
MKQRKALGYVSTMNQQVKGRKTEEIRYLTPLNIEITKLKEVTL